jgi:hypothetical protein
MKATKIEKSPLRALFWKDEILQIMYWMDGEGFGNRVSAIQILALLNTNADNLNYHLVKLATDGYLEMEGDASGDGDTVSLSETGKKEAGRRFAEAFQGLQKAGHGECGPDCEFCYGPDGVKLENCVHHCDHHH